MRMRARVIGVVAMCVLSVSVGLTRIHAAAKASAAAKPAVMAAAHKSGDREGSPAVQAGKGHASDGKSYG